jgi:hypothetical protein
MPSLYRLQFFGRQMMGDEEMNLHPLHPFVVFLTVLLLCDMVYTAIDNVLAPWEPLFWQWGGYAVMAFLTWMAFRVGQRFDEWLHRLEMHPRGKGRVRRG